MPEFEILAQIYNSNYPRTKTEIPRVGTAPQGMETGTPNPTG